MPTYPFTEIGALLNDNGELACVTKSGESGCVLYGPYVDLPPGSHTVTFRVSCTEKTIPNNSPCGHLDICSDTGTAVLVERAFSPNDLTASGGKIDLPFTTATPGRYEFRVFTNGSVGLRVQENRTLTMDNDFPNLSGSRDQYNRVRYSGFLLENIRQFQYLAENGASVSATDTGAKVALFGVSMLVAHTDDFHIIREILITNDYNFLTKTPFCVVDIGMNVGLASLYFATLPQVKEVHSFEPFQGPYKRALANFQVNEALAKKITAHNIGLGNGTSVKTVLYNDTSPIGVSTRGLTHGTPTEILIQDAAEVLSAIVDQARAKGLKVAVKMDCEGSEFPIFESLIASNILQNINVFLIEWHKWWSADKTQRNLIAPLLDHDFVVLDQTDVSNPHAGQLYAIRTGA